MIVGIDQSLTGTGLALIDNDGNLLKNQLVTTGKLKGIQRLHAICEETLAFCSDIKERFVIAREGYSFGSRGRATFSLGELGGCIDLSLYLAKDINACNYYVLPPTVVKKMCLGSGAVKKDSAYLLKVFNRFDMEFSDDNQADAYMIARTLLYFLKARISDRQQDFFDTLKVYEKKAILATSISDKESGVTKANMKNLEADGFANFANDALTKYQVFMKVET